MCIKPLNDEHKMSSSSSLFIKVLFINSVLDNMFDIVQWMLCLPICCINAEAVARFHRQMGPENT